MRDALHRMGWFHDFVCNTPTRTECIEPSLRPASVSLSTSLPTTSPSAPVPDDESWAILEALAHHAGDMKMMDLATEAEQYLPASHKRGRMSRATASRRLDNILIPAGLVERNPSGRCVHITLEGRRRLKTRRD